MSKLGIDVSTFQGHINWDKVKPKIDFAIIRAGYGKNNIDKRFRFNADECNRLGIPFGMYWFSYALSAEQATAEADYICNLADQYHPSYPICYDWEYDSDNYAKKCGVAMTGERRREFAKAFLNRVEERGYYAMLYSNYDYLTKGFAELLNKYDLWYAAWQKQQPSRQCGIWQYSSTKTVDGICGHVDANISYKDYTKIIKKDINEIVNEIFDGKWGNGQERIDKLTLAGYNYPYIQSLVNQKAKECQTIAKEVLQGKWGNGETRKKKLKEAGYPYNYVQAIVNNMCSAS